VRHAADVWYGGQGYHLEIPLDDADPDPLARLYRDFLLAHDRVYGHATEVPARFVNLRTVHRAEPAAAIARPSSARPSAAQSAAPKRQRPTLIDPVTGFENADLYARASLPPNATFAGPAIVEQPDTTILVPRGWHAVVIGGVVYCWNCADLPPM
jgi:N-methylhydantoinase A/oxoprolinase/acetone carboxylase beta subunit